MNRIPRAPIALAVIVIAACSDPAPPAVSVESIALSLDSIAIQFRDSSSKLTASPKGALGVDLDAGVNWQSKNPSVVTLVPNGKVARLIPVRPGSAEVEASSENIIATAKVVVLDTVFSVQLVSADTLVSLGHTLSLTANVQGPPNASRNVAWMVVDTAKARIDSVTQATRTAFITSRDTGRTEVIATAAADRLKTARIPFRTARPVSLFFESQPGQATAPIRANDILIPGPIVRALDILGNVFLGPLNVTLAVEPNSGTSGASLFGTPTVTTTNGEGRFENIGVDLQGADYRLTASSPGLSASTSAPFTVGPECPGTPYTVGVTISGALTTSACQSRSNEYYDRYVVESAVTQYVSIRVSPAALVRINVVFRDGARFTSSDSLAAVASAGTFSFRVTSTTTNATGAYQVRSGPPNIARGVFQVGGPFVCQIIQVQRGITLQDDLKCSAATPFPCGSRVGTVAVYRLHLAANMGATITATSAAFDPCLTVWTQVGASVIAEDPDVAGRNTARVVVPPSSVARNVVIGVVARSNVPVATPFTISIQP